ncbi:MAG TPA: BrnA antitoxin family protein [Rhizomicrobium sp.]|jgi:hypothetical protein|nr:BrnA antitoxin family protein [Rhizomicrobium sp.]
MARKVKDNDAPEITAELFAKMRPMKEATPGMVEAIKAARGRPKLADPKKVVSIRLSGPAYKAWGRLNTSQRTVLVSALEEKIRKAKTSAPAKRARA